MKRIALAGLLIAASYPSAASAVPVCPSEPWAGILRSFGIHVECAIDGDGPVASAPRAGIPPPYWSAPVEPAGSIVPIPISVPIERSSSIRPIPVSAPVELPRSIRPIPVSAPVEPPSVPVPGHQEVPDLAGG